MNQNPIDRSRFEAIEAYVLGNMPTAEREAFELEVTKDAALRAEVHLQRENTLAVELGGMERMLRSVGAEHAGHTAKANSGWTHYLKYAAVVAIVLSGAFWMLTRPSTNERLYAEHYTADPGLPVAMSATDDHAFQDAMVAYKLGDYAEARGKWLPLLQAEPANDTLRFYIACASLGMHDALSAIPLFEGVANDSASVFSSKSKWYLFLCYIKQGEVEKAKSLSLDDDATYGERVRAMKAELK